MGFRSATKAGISIGITDMIIPREKSTQLEKAYREIAEVEKQYRRGIITDGERKNKVQDIWTHTGEELANALFRTLEYNDGRKDMNPVFMMVDSGARGNRTQVKQLAGMRGLMAKPSGEIIERPIISNFREGLSVLEYFISTHGARKGLADTALKTADSGYLTRKLVDAVAGCHHHRGRLRNDQRYRRPPDLRGRRRGRQPFDPHHRAHELRDRRRTPSPARPWSPPARSSTRKPRRRSRKSVSSSSRSARR